MGLLSGRESLHKAIHLDYWHTTNRFRRRNGDLLLLPSLLLCRRRLPGIRNLQHHLFRLMDPTHPF